MNSKIKLFVLWNPWFLFSFQAPEPVLRWSVESRVTPAIKALASGSSAEIPLDGAIATMLAEHDEAGAALAKMRELTKGFTPPAEACNTYRALFAGLTELEEVLHRHIHLENSALFPVARKMAGI